MPWRHSSFLWAWQTFIQNNRSIFLVVQYANPRVINISFVFVTTDLEILRYIALHVISTSFIHYNAMRDQSFKTRNNKI